LIEGVKIHHWQSFPSGHTMTAFAFASASLFILKKAQLSLTFLLGAMLVGYSRMYLFQHFPRDVFAGSIFGIGVVLLLTPFFMNILKEK
jgi:membrane-associated phospholipid phosphatase